MHFDLIVQVGILLVCLGIFFFLASHSVKILRVGRKREKKHEHEA